MTTSNNPTRFEDEEYKSSAGTRRHAREITLQGLYSLELSGNSLQMVLGQIRENPDADAEALNFADKMIEKTYANREDLDSYIIKRAANWDFSRIAIIDKLIMRMAICEFLYFFDIPPKVSIDEAIELSKVYSTEKSGRFVNGILDAILLELKKTNQLVKSGRGLKETSGRKD